MDVLGADFGGIPCLGERTVDLARVQCLGPLRPGEAFHGGPVLGDDPLDRRLRHNRDGHSVDGFDVPAEYMNLLAGEWAYGGFAYPHFGHCMAEVVHRILPSRARHPGCRFVFVGFPGPEPTEAFAGLPDFMKEILTLLNVSAEQVTVLRQHSIIERLHIVEQGADLGGWPKPGYVELIRDVVEPKLRSLWREIEVGNKVYVSRSRLPGGGGFMGEDYIERMLALHGFSIFHPEEHRFLVQIATYAGASTLMFAEGSACHGVELLGRDMLRESLLLVRRPEVGAAFERILAPRSQSYAAYFGTLELGTVVTDPVDGSPLRHLGAVMFDIAALSDFLQTQTGIPLTALDRHAYREQALRDWDAYVAFHRTNSHMLRDAELSRLNMHALRMLS